MHDVQLLFNVQLLIHTQSLIDRRSQFAMEISWDGVLPTQEQWESVQGHAFECLEGIKGAQMAISTRVMLELLRRMGHPQGPIANLMKPQMAALIIGTLVPREGWATSELSNIHLVSSSRDSLDLLLLSFGLELGLEPPTRLFIPAGGVTSAVANVPENEAVPLNAEAAATKQPRGAPDLVAILATMQQGFAQQENAMASLAGDTNTSLRNFEAMVDCRLWDQGKEFSQWIESVHRDLASDFQRRLDAVGLDLQKEVDSLKQRLQ